MDATLFSWIAVGALLLASPLLMIMRDWRWVLGLLAVVYLAAFILVSRHWPLGMAVVKLVTGWMGIAALGMTRLSLAPPEAEKGAFLVEGSFFRLFGAALALLIAVSGAAAIEKAIPGIGLPVIVGGLALIGTGLFQLGMTFDVLRVVVGLLVVLSGFEVIYAVVETSILVAALLSAANLGLALAGSYLFLRSSPAAEEVEESL
ncbi:MAG: hypothetical protein HY869_07265 [Chloroflexi bacterium]|nr:hypothetical protein [Chloroflexota bacterium]